MQFAPNIRACALAAPLLAASAFAQSSIPLRTLTAPVASDSGLFQSTPSLRPLSNGRLLVNDSFGRRVLLFDSTMTSYRIVADTAPGAPTKYPNTFSAIMPYLGDSTLLIDREAQALLVLGPSGAFVRAMAAPSPNDLPLLSFSAGSAATDPKGRMIYRVSRRPPPFQQPEAGKVVSRTTHDSAYLVRADFDTRAIDTIASHAMPVQKMVSFTVGTTTGYAFATNPLPQTDEWVMLPDGTIAIVRGQDYHIDWVKPDGSRTSSPKMPFDWKRITLDDKQRILDSAKQAAAEREAKAAAAAAANGSASSGRATGGSGGGLGSDVAVAGGRGLAPAAASAGSGARGPIHVPFTTVDVDDLPDYYPPIRPGTVRVDPEGNVWILPTTSVFSAGGLTFDVVNRKGEIFQRVQLPPKRNLLAVGAGGVVYMINTVGGRLERARINR